ncbi:MAG: putative molybdenum cofactor biosynthesis protein [Ilumatobacteraceae bacterium]|nr:putative molybdenum cofactor biosynthesis protein [Ilumatobacteraceae bacterium]
MSDAVLGAVLVGGRSSRMGRDKATLEVDGIAMARRVAAALSAAGLERVVAVGPTHLAAGLDVVVDLHPGDGPLGGILTALAAASPGPALVVACDLPWLDAASVLALVDAYVDACGGAAGDGRPVAVVGRTDRVEPLFALWAPATAPVLSAAFTAGERAVHRALDLVEVIEVAVGSHALANVNTPEDLLSE